MEIFADFLRAMESHPSVTSTVGVALNHTSTGHALSNRATLSENDLNGAEDLLLIAASLIMEIKVYEPSVLNPYNMTAISMLEHGMPYFPQSLRIKQLLVKLYSKLGMVQTVTNLYSNVTPRSDKSLFTSTKDFEAMGAQRFDLVTSFGDSEAFEELMT
jgi:hypothetical protein